MRNAQTNLIYPGPPCAAVARLPALLPLLLLAPLLAGCLADDEKASGAGSASARQEGGGDGDVMLLNRTLLEEKIEGREFRLVEIPLGRGDIQRSFSTTTLPALPILNPSPDKTHYVLNLSEVWRTFEVRYQVWVVDDAGNASAHGQWFNATGEGKVREHGFTLNGKLDTLNTVYVTVEPKDDNAMGFVVLRGEFDGDRATLAPARTLQGTGSLGRAEAGRGIWAVSLAVVGLPNITAGAYHLWVERGDSAVDLGPLEQDNPKDPESGWGVSGGGETNLSGKVWLEVVGIALTLEPEGNKDKKPSNAILMRGVFR